MSLCLSGERNLTNFVLIATFEYRTEVADFLSLNDIERT